jgi:hydroxypyruvate reductase
MARRDKALAILYAALAAVNPVEAVKRFVSLEDSSLRVGRRSYDLRRCQRIIVVGAGKASAAMAQGLEEVLGDRIATGLVNVKYGHSAPTRIVAVQEAGHPIPDENGLLGAQRIRQMVDGAGGDDLVICLLSGGGSALLALPAPEVTLEDKQGLTELLLRCGATINEINTVRKHLSCLKGGNLARLACPAQVVSLVLSDVVGSPLDVIASGPTVPDPSTFGDAWQVLERYGLTSTAPASVVKRLSRGRQGLIPDTPKPGDLAFARVQNLIIGSSETAAAAAEKKAQELGFNTLLLSTYVEGEAREVARVLAGLAKEVYFHHRPLARPACLIASGETTVTVKGDGLGGRNQELALAAAIALEGLVDVTVLSAATDGSDGPTDAAGAIVDGSTVERARARGLNPADHLARNDSYRFFQALEEQLVTGPTRTNVNDLYLALIF